MEIQNTWAMFSLLAKVLTPMAPTSAPAPMAAEIRPYRRAEACKVRVTKNTSSVSSDPAPSMIMTAATVIVTSTRL